MMLDYYFQTEDAVFAKKTLLPMVDTLLTFYEKHYEKDNNGKLFITPAQSLETYRTDVENPLPVIAGLRAVLTRLLLLPESMSTDAQRVGWHTMLATVPPIPVRYEDGRVRLIPAERYADKRGNRENPELYTVFPYQIHAIGLPGLEVALNAWPLRGMKDVGGWSQNLIDAAAMGLTDKAKTLLVKTVSPVKKLESRFPVFWGPNGNWTPDQDHGGVFMIGIHKMILQWDDAGKMYLLPAWPKEWNVEFKLHASKKTIVEGSYVDGELVTRVSPQSRKAEIVLPAH